MNSTRPFRLSLACLLGVLATARFIQLRERAVLNIASHGLLTVADSVSRQLFGTDICVIRGSVRLL